MDIAVHHTGHELDRMVRLQPRGLIADDRIGRRVGFVEAVVGELLQQVEDLDRLLSSTPFLRRPSEFGPFCVHRFLDLLTHRAAQQVGAAKR